MMMNRSGTKPSPQVETVSSICGICPAGCGVEVTLVEGKIERLKPLPDHPQGIVCPRG